MQKLVLVDEFDREYKRLQRPAAAVAKTDHSLRLSDTLRNSSLADDRKVRQYVGELHRYLNVDNRARENQLVNRTGSGHAASITTTTTAVGDPVTVVVDAAGSQKEESEKKNTARQTSVGSVWTPKIDWMPCTPILGHPAVSAVCEY